MIATVGAGRYIWLVPLGYVNGRAKGIRSLELDESRSVSLIQRSFGLIDAGLTVTKAHQQVTREGLTCRNGHKLSLKKEYVEALSVAIDVNLEAHRKWVRDKTGRVSRRIASLKEKKDAITQKCIKGVIPGAMVKE